MTLSEERAAIIRDEIVAMGVASSRLVAKGYGDTQPLESIPDFCLQESAPLDEMRKSPGWDDRAEELYLLGDNPSEMCSQLIKKSERVEFLILRRSDEKSD